uniref:BPTI/Kunitz inhibitor domain-containing protein n=1 Tax=Romanomermis culicivorax TaxID=13658 RepID=A0A915IHQ7_ROMCU
MDAKLGHEMNANMGQIRQVRTAAKLGRTPKKPMHGEKLSCKKITPFRIFCEKTKKLSQSTIRWYFSKDFNTCVSYTFGYCGEKISARETNSSITNLDERANDKSTSTVQPEYGYDDDDDDDDKAPLLSLVPTTAFF